MNIFFIDHIEKHDESFTHYSNLGFEVVLPNEFLSRQVDVTDHIIINCCLNIDAEGNEKTPLDFYGISFIQELRRNNYKNQVLFFSFLPKKYFQKEVLNAKILFFPGHSFVQLPSLSSNWVKKFDEFDPLTDLSLYDVKHHCCGIEQIIDEHFHSLTPKFIAAKTLDQTLIQAGTDLIHLVYKSLNKTIPDTTSFLNSNTSGTEALRWLKSACESVLPVYETKEFQSLKPEWKYWKVLWLDDEENEKSPLYKELVARLGSEDKVLMSTSYEDALQKWEADKAYGEISLVICDYRLKDKEGLPTSKQGYDFMKYLADDGRSVGKLVYSGLKRKFLIESFKHYGIQINIFSKIDFNQGNPDDLAFLSDEVIRLGDNHWIEINNAPQATEWVTIAPTYHNFKNGFLFYTFQNHLSRLAKQNLEVFIELFNVQRTKEDLWRLKFVDDFKVRTGYFPEGNDAKTEAIKEILVARRFAIGLYAFLKSDRNAQSSLLFKENYLDYIKVVLYNSSSNGKGYEVGDFSDPKVYSQIKKNSTLKLIPKFNALTFDSTWPLGLLPEEFGWLKFDMGLVEETFDEIYSYLRQVQIIKNSFQYLFSEKFFNDLISKEDGTLKVSGGKIHFNDDNIPLIRNTADAKKLIQSVYDRLDVDSYENHKQFIQFWRRLVSQLNKGEFKASGILSDFLYFITKTLKASKIDFDQVSATFLRQDAEHLKPLFQTLISIAGTLKSKSDESIKLNFQSLNKLEEFKILSPFSKGIVKNILKAMMQPNQAEEISTFLTELVARLDENDTDDFSKKIKTSVFALPLSAYSVEQEFIIIHHPWEIAFPKHQRLALGFPHISDELYQAIELKDLSYSCSSLENSNNIFDDALSDFIHIFHDKENSTKFMDIYFRAIAYARSRADFYRQQKLTDTRSKVRKSGDTLSATELAENIRARKSLQEEIEYYNKLLDQDEHLRLDSEYSADVEEDDIW